MSKLPADFPSVEDQALPWPAKLDNPTDEERKTFTNRRLELDSLIRRDFHTSMTPTVKLIASYLLECVNSETLLCFPSYRTILETLSLGKNEKTVQRAIDVLRKRGWLYSWRPDRNKSNRFIFLRNDAVVSQILDYQDAMRVRREEDRIEREERERTQMSGREMAIGTQMSVRERTPMSGKSFNVIRELSLGIEGKTYLIEGNDCAMVKAGDQEAAYPIPENEQEAENILAEICAGREPIKIIRDVLHGFLMAGNLTPAKADSMLSAKQKEAA
ncbi:helix-turn-helix domain-containing protein [Neorhizobium sp. DT-125]|uniref:helix-turn-helix domain-containing protein n=1 Tax=Neorhizobium sp. DT-125 TaxID=3396163 RepID=UPI003F1BD32C